MAERIDRRQVLIGAGAGAAGLAAGAAAVAGIAAALDERTPAQLSGTITAGHRPAGFPATEPGARAWRSAGRIIVPLLPQTVAPPFLERAAVDELVVSALHDGTELAFRLEWRDRQVDDLDGIHRFHDAVAVQLPAKGASAPPPITMGGPGQPVHILQWRATWQRDLAEKTGVDQIYPRVVHDVMPDDVLPEETAQLYWVGREAGNPLSLATRPTSVEQAVAEGFGSVTHVDDTRARGGALHDGERWHVTLAFPLRRDGIGEPLRPGSSWPVAFALWLGQQGNRGGRKHFANWLQLRLEAAT
jgi:hypothetical protein